MGYIHREGWRFIGIAFVVALLLAFVSWWTLVLTLPICAWVVAFFRDPVRVTPLGEGLVVSAADGVVQSIKLRGIPDELSGGEGGRKLLCMAVFMNIFDCHVNRAPVGGKVVKRVYKAGSFLNASLDKASEKNERASLVISAGLGGLGTGGLFYVVQVAGLVARRIVGWKDEGDELEAGERFGLIRFGSRVDIYLPEGYVALVAEGMRVRAGESVIAKLSKKGIVRGGRRG